MVNVIDQIWSKLNNYKDYNNNANDKQLTVNESINKYIIERKQTV